MSIIERDRAAAYFADTENGAQVLLSSSIILKEKLPICLPSRTLRFTRKS